MELGNMLFGNSRGEFPIDRSLQDDFCERVLEPMGFDSYGRPESELPAGWRELDPWGYTNDVFTVRPYWWGDCQCGWEEVDCDQDHAPDCYQTRLRALRTEDYSRAAWKRYERARKALCKEMGLSWQWGSEIHCTCDFRERYDAWFERNKLGPSGHSESCPVVLPNFECKPLGVAIQVYKYFLRDSYCNVPLDSKLVDDLADLARAG